MTTKEKLISLLNDRDTGECDFNSWEDDFLESFEQYLDTDPEDIPDLSKRQENVIEQMYENKGR